MGSIRDLVGNLYAIIPVVYGLTKIDDLQILILLIVGLVLLIVVRAVTQYRHFSYQITDDSIMVRKGMFFKKQTNLSYDRIQNVSYERPFYYRPFDLVIVRVDGAGSAADEIHLSALEPAQADSIQAVIQTRRHQATHGDVHSVDSEQRNIEEEDHNRGNILITRSLSDLVLHGLSNNRAWIILGAGGAIYGQFADALQAWTAKLGIDFSLLVENQSALATLAYLFSIFVFSLMIVAGLSVLGAIVSYYDFELRRNEKTLTVNRGLFNRHEVHMQVSRIQSVYFRQDWLDRMLGRVNLIFEQLSHGLESGDMGNADKLLVPSVTFDQAEALCREVFPAPALSSLEFVPSSQRMFYRNAIIPTLVAGVVSLSLLLAGFGWLVLGVAPIYLFVLLVVYWAWRRKGVTLHGSLAILRQGIFGIDHVIVELSKLQKVRFSQTVLMARHDLASVEYTVASRTLDMPFLRSGTALELVNYGAYQVESSQRSWM